MPVKYKYASSFCCSNGTRISPSATSHPVRTMGLPVLEVVLFYPRVYFFQNLVPNAVSNFRSGTWTLMLTLFWLYTVLVKLRVPFASWLLHVGCGWSPKCWQWLLLPRMVVWLHIERRCLLSITMRSPAEKPHLLLSVSRF